MGKLHYNSNIERVRYKQKGKKWKIINESLSLEIERGIFSQKNAQQ